MPSLSDRLADREESADGRFKIRTANRQTVIETMVAMFLDGSYNEADYRQISARSEVSVRTVYRLFEDKDSLYHDALASYLLKIRDDIAIPSIGKGSFDERIVRFLDARLRLFEAHGRTAMMLMRMANLSTSQVIHSFPARKRAFLREQVRLQFAPELEHLEESRAEGRLSMVDLGTQFESLGYLLYEIGMGRSDVRLLLERLLRATFRPGSTSFN